MGFLGLKNREEGGLLRPCPGMRHSRWFDLYFRSWGARWECYQVMC